jgi:hypothetical protein
MLQLLEHPGARPLLQAPPGRHPREAELLGREHLPGDSGSQYEDDGFQGGPVACPWPTAPKLFLFGNRQEWGDSLPQRVRYEFTNHRAKVLMVRSVAHRIVYPQTIFLLGALNF